MLPDRVSNPGPLTYESGALPIALRVPAIIVTDLHKFLLLTDFIMNANIDQSQYVVSLKREKLILQISSILHSNLTLMFFPLSV